MKSKGKLNSKLNETSGIGLVVLIILLIPAMALPLKYLITTFLGVDFDIGI